MKKTKKEPLVEDVKMIFKRFTIGVVIYVPIYFVADFMGFDSPWDTTKQSFLIISLTSIFSVLFGSKVLSQGHKDYKKGQCS